MEMLAFWVILALQKAQATPACIIPAPLLLWRVPGVIPVFNAKGQYPTKLFYPGFMYTHRSFDMVFKTVIYESYHHTFR